MGLPMTAVLHTVVPFDGQRVRVVEFGHYGAAGFSFSRRLVTSQTNSILTPLQLSHKPTVVAQRIIF